MKTLPIRLHWLETISESLQVESIKYWPSAECTNITPPRKLLKHVFDLELRTSPTAPATSALARDQGVKYRCPGMERRIFRRVLWLVRSDMSLPKAD